MCLSSDYKEVCDSKKGSALLWSHALTFVSTALTWAKQMNPITWSWGARMMPKFTRCSWTLLVSGDRVLRWGRRRLRVAYRQGGWDLRVGKAASSRVPCFALL